jgi:hypothetical protein
MILGAEVALIIYGILAMVRGKFSVGKGRDVTGNRARILGFLCLTPLPFSFLLGVIVGPLSLILYGSELANVWIFAALEVIIRDLRQANGDHPFLRRMSELPAL